VEWLKAEHPMKEKILPSEWIGKQAADAAVSAASRVLNEINNNPQHEIRNAFDKFTIDLIHQLKNDPNFINKGENIKQYILNDATFKNYIFELWSSIKTWLRQDIESRNSVIRQKIIDAGRWIGVALANDPSLRKSINSHLEESAKAMAPDFSNFLTKHIRDTIKSWDAKEMSHQIELNIGKDLQFIRINGTLIGGMIGAIIFMITQGVQLLKQL
jgi:uncharacterized membrane-anchored protein YjiN (DUF445 family)